MSGHALLSPSSAHRWINCTPSPRLEATLPEKPSVDADTGTLAHSVCEITAKKKFKKVKAAEYNKVMKKLKTDPLWDDDMLSSAEIYSEHLAERAMQFENEPYIAFEVSVDISEFVPEAFGRCDCIMFGGDTLVITDYKNGKGVVVAAENNPQLQLYALGALKLYRPLYGDAIKNIEIRIDQPRIERYDCWSCSTEDLLAWGASVKLVAEKAYLGVGEFHAGEWCQFCRANGVCKAQASQQMSAFDDFSSVVGQSTEILTPDDMAKILERGKVLVDWFKKVEAKALETALSGNAIPGYKVVEGVSYREWSDQDAALDTLMKSGIERAAIYDSVPKSLAQLEKMIGKTKFNELVGSYVFKPRGNPKLALASDKRPEYTTAIADFSGVANSDN